MKDRDLIVMIDDDSDDHFIFEQAIGEIDRPLKCMFFPTCEKALAHFRTPGVSAPNLVLVDLNLPGISGDECLVQLQQLQEFDSPYIVIYSTSVPVEWHPRLERIGVDKFLEKPGSLPLLVNELRKLIA